MSSQKEITISIGLMLQFFFCVRSHGAIQLPKPPELDSISGNQRSSYYQVTVGNPILTLKENTLLKAEEVILDGTIVTNGYELVIDTRKLDFKPGAKIIAFSSAQDSTTSVPRSGVQGDNGQLWGGKGGKGQDGKTGFKGKSGKQSPGRISIFAAEVVGTPEVDGKGQEGGKGGQGGQGGRGGNGAKGRKAHASFFSSRSAGKGGDSGQRGVGGQGGPGGQGGEAVTIEFLTCQAEMTPEFIQGIQSEGGEGGAGGEGGDMGDLGSPGEGGDGDSAWRVVSSKHVPPGPRGSVDDSSPNPCHLGAGESGEKGSSDPNGVKIESFSELEGLRSQVAEAWFRFHWSRTLKLLVSESINHLYWMEDIQNFETDESLAFLQEELSQDALEKSFRLLSSWQTQLVEPLSHLETLPEEMLLHRDPVLPIAMALVDGLTAISQDLPNTEVIRNQFTAAVTQANDLLLLSLEGATQRCIEYNQKVSELSEQLLGKTSHFYIPVCLGEPNLIEPGNINAEIQVLTRYSLDVPEFVSYKKIDPTLIASETCEQARRIQKSSLYFAKFFSLVDKIFSGVLGFSEAYAGIEVVFVDGHLIPIQSIKAISPRENVIVSSDAATGYRIISKKDAIENLSQHLKVLSIFVGK